MREIELEQKGAKFFHEKLHPVIYFGNNAFQLRLNLFLLAPLSHFLLLLYHSIYMFRCFIYFSIV